MKTILIVDDHPVLRRGLASLIEFEPDLGVSGEATSCRSALESIEECEPDAVIVDIALEGSDGLDLVKNMKSRHPDIPALVLSVYDEAVYAERALKAGAKGYVTKRQLDETVLTAIRCVLDGETFMTETLKARLAEKFIRGQTLAADSPLESLSDRELQVFQQVGQGLATRQIAERFSLSIKTIESHLEHIKQKLTLASAAELARAATLWVETGCTH